MEDNDYCNSSVPKEILDRRNDFITERWKELHEFYLRHSDETIKYLLYVNAGGAATSIGFMGASESIRNLICMRVALCFFSFGLTSVGILRVLMLHKIRYLFDNWRKDVEKYWENNIGFAELTQRDEQRTKSDLYAFVFGYISGGSFIVGLILGGVSLFNY